MQFQTITDFIMQNSYYKALFILVSFFIVSKIVVYISEKWFLKLTAKTKTKVDDLIVEKTNKPVSLALLLLGLRLALSPLELGKIFNLDVHFILSKVLESLIVMVIANIIIKIINIVIDEWGKEFAKRTKSRLDDQLISLFHRFSKITIIVLALLYVLDLWGVQVGPFLASLGIAGIAIAFALKSTLANIFGGISLIMDKTIKVGDVIKLDPETMGTVTDVGLRSTKIRNFNNEIIIIPNGVLVDNKIENHVLPDPSARIVVNFGVEYGSDVDKVKKVIMTEIKKLKDVMKEPQPQILFMEMADFALNFSARFWVEDYKERLKTKEQATCLFYKALNKNKIGIPFPTNTVYLKK